MSNELVVIDGMSNKEIAALTGQDTAPEFVATFGSLGVNRELEDDDGNRLPVGVFRVLFNGNSVFAPTVKFRPFLNTYQYSIYDGEAQKYVRSSVYTTDIFAKEIPDSAGGNKCGKVSKKEFERLTEAEQAAQKKIRCSRFVFGLVSITGTNNRDEATTLADVPVRMKLGGRNFMPFGDTLKGLSDKKLLMLNHNIDLSITKEKISKTVTSYLVNSVADVATRVDFTAENLETLKGFQNYIQKHNDKIMQAWSKARGLASGATDAEFTDVSDDVAPVDELDDDISDVK